MATLQNTTSFGFPHCPTAPDWRLGFDALVAQFDWLAAMAGCPQDPVWHAEGDVLTHVGMVCEQLVALRAWRELPDDERNNVFAAALLHDVAKPKCTKLEDGRIRSRGHAVHGARMARRILMQDPAFADHPVQFGAREQVVALVRHHGLPATCLDKIDPERALITTSMTARCDLLSILAEADARGRRTLGPDDMPDRVALFREFALEHDCLGRPYAFASPHSRWHYFRTPTAPPTVDVYDPADYEVVVMSGLPAAGKDTWIARHLPDHPVVSLDALRHDLGVDPAADQGRVIDAARAAAKVHLRRREPFVWNATNTTRMLRDGLIDLFAAYHARVRIVYCEGQWPTMLARNAARRDPVPRRVLDKLLDHLDLPDATEAHEVQYAVA